MRDFDSVFGENGAKILSPSHKIILEHERNQLNSLKEQLIIYHRARFGDKNVITELENS